MPELVASWTRLGGLDQPDRAARARPELDQRRDLVQAVAVRPPRRIGERDREADHVAVYEDPLRGGAMAHELCRRQLLLHFRQRPDDPLDHRGLAGDGAATTAETAARLRLRPQHVRRLEELALRRLRAELRGSELLSVA